MFHHQYNKFVLDRISTKTTTQTTSLHWRNDQNNDKVGAKTIGQYDNDNDNKSSNKRRRMDLQKGADGRKFH